MKESTAALSQSSSRTNFEPLVSPGYARSLAQLRRCFRDAPVGTRIHVLGRYLSCPFLRALRFLPRDGEILDVGGGHGLFARLALDGGARRVVVVEPDVRKLPHACRDGRIDYVAGYADAVAGQFDGVTLFDVLYRVALADRNALLALLRERLKPGGVLLIKELDSTAPLKSRWNRLQEAISDNLLGLTLGTEFSYESPSELQQRLERLGFTAARAERIDRGYPHAHVVIHARR